MQWFLSNQAIIQTALIYVLLGYSLQIPLRAGVFSFAAGGFYSFGGYTSGVLVKSGLDPTLSIGIAMLSAGVLGLGLSLILSRLRAIYLAMATLAFIFLVKLVAESLPITGGTIGLLGVPRIMSTWQIILIVLIVTAGVWLMSRGRIARITETMRIDELLAGTVGMSVVRQRHIVFVISSVIGALAGAMYVLTFTVILPDQVGFELMLTALTILVIGGTRHWFGVVIGAFVVALLPQWLAVFGEWRPVVDGIVVVAIAVLAANGVTGVVDALARRLRARRGRQTDSDADSPLPENEVSAQEVTR